MKIPVLVKSKTLEKKIENECGSIKKSFTPIFFTEGKPFLEYLKYELPEFNIIHFPKNDETIFSVVNTLGKDSWLHAGGIIALHEEQEEKLLKKVRKLNIISLINLSSFNFSFPRVIRIVWENRSILFHRDLQQKLLPHIAGSFVMDNDPFDVRTYANLVTNYLFNSNYINEEQKQRLHVALFEMLMNAVEHGNCEITYEEKSGWLETGGDIIDLIREKNKNPKIAKKKVVFSYRITSAGSTFTIKDEGKGFDWKKRVTWETDDGIPELHGMGIKMTEIYTDTLSYNKAGNEATFTVQHMQNESNLIPNIFTGQEEVVFEKNRVIFREGEESNYLYYIVSGELSILSRGKQISTLTPEDLFLGEMSFLLNNKRSATVKAGTKCVLIKVSKDQFLNLIKNNPHYGILLAKLLAQRLVRMR